MRLASGLFLKKKKNAFQVYEGCVKRISKIGETFTLCTGGGGREKKAGFSSVTWEVASQARGAAEHLPQEGGVVLSVLLEHLLQGLGPVELVQHDGGCKSRTKRTRL